MLQKKRPYFVSAKNNIINYKKLLSYSERSLDLNDV